MARTKFRTLLLANKRRKGFRGVQKQNIVRQQSDDGLRPNVGETTEVIGSEHTAMERKLCNSPLNMTLSGKQSRFTRRRAREEGFTSSLSTYQEACGSALINLSLLRSLCRKMKCSKCFSKKSGFQLLVNEKKRHGLAMELYVKCVHCFTILDVETSTKLGNGVFDVNRRATLACNSVKGGRQALANFYGIMNLPPPVTCRAFNNDLKKSAGAVREKANEVMLQASERIRTITICENPQLDKEDPTLAVPVAVSVDGTWQKRGFSSKNGVVFVIANGTGEIIDAEVLSLFCQECNHHRNDSCDSEAYRKWTESHNSHCTVNFEGSSGAMEAIGATQIFERSVDTRKLKYTTFVGDGDSSTYHVVSKRMQEMYGERYIVKKEECVGHIQKRMGNALRSFVTDMKGKKLSDGKTVGGKGRLTKDTIDKFQRYFGKAIRENTGEKMIR